MIRPGNYSVWFKTPIGEGAGVVEFKSEGSISGGDSTFHYEGDWKLIGGKFRATLSAKRVVDGPPGVFGLDQLDISVTGMSFDGGTSVSCTGIAKQAPGLSLKLTLLRMRDP